MLFIPEKVRSAIRSFEERFLSEPYDSENDLPRHVGYILGHHLIAKTFPTQKTDDSIYATFLSLLNEMQAAVYKHKTNPEYRAEQQYNANDFFPDIKELKAYVVGFRNENRERFDLVVNALNLERLKHFVES